MELARMHHYVFAHEALPEAFWEGPARVATTLLSPDGTRFLKALWAEVGAACEEKGRRPLPHEGLRVEIQPRDGRVMAVVTLPLALNVTEASHVALVLSPPRRRWLVLKTPPGADYFTLEVGSCSDGSPRTVLGAWTSDGRHLNLGDGPEATPEAFADAIAAHLGR